MTTTTHSLAPEEVMAWLDGELSRAEAQAIETHVSECSECAELVEQFRAASRALAQWGVDEAPASTGATLASRAAKATSAAKGARPAPIASLNWTSGRLWRAAGAGAGAALLIVTILIFSLMNSGSRGLYYAEPQPATNSSADGQSLSDHNAQNFTAREKDKAGNATRELPLEGKTDKLMQLQPGVAGIESDRSLYEQAGKGRTEAVNGRVQGGGGGGGENDMPAPQGPMIARTVALTIQVKDSAGARAALDAILARHHGYSASLRVNTPENGQHSVQASLRIPGPDLAPALGELRAMGRVLTETQSGEEVTQQHADLVARLQNSREEETRLRAILEQRSGKIEDVLQVEEEIARVRGEIEQMEAEQKTLEHRVDFATVELQLTEEYRERLGAQGAAQSPSTQIYNSFITGIRNAGGMLLSLVLFIEEVGPAFLVLAIILAGPALLLWQRYRRARAGVL